MKKRYLLLTFVILFLCMLTGCGCAHEWAEATCTTAKTCSKCGETEGEALGHQWERATCIAPETCSACAETRGDMLAHVFGDWQVISETEMERPCEVCGHAETAPIDDAVLVENYLNGTGWVSKQLSADLWNVCFDSTNQFDMLVNGERYTGTWEFAGKQEGDTTTGYHIVVTDTELKLSDHLVLIQSAEEDSGFYIAQQSGAGYVLYEQVQVPDPAGVWVPRNAEWYKEYGEPVPPTLIISEDNAAELITEDGSYYGNAEECDAGIADMRLGGFNNKAYCVRLDGHTDVYFFMDAFGNPYLYREIDQNTSSTTRYVKEG